MFGIFKRKHKPSVTPEDKDWIERNIIWFIEVFGLDKLKAEPFILPAPEIFPYDNLKDETQFLKLFEQLCQYWELKPEEIVVKFFDDIKSKQWTTWAPGGSFREPAGLFTQEYTIDEKRFNIQLAKSNLDNPLLLVSVIAHELGHVKLLGENYVKGNDGDMEPLTDLASIFFGFGIFVANSCQTTDINWISRSGYLPNQLISYTNALICYITENEASNYYSLFNKNTRELFKQDYEFLKVTDETLLKKEKVLECELICKLGRDISEGFSSKNYDKILEASGALLKINSKNITAFNNIGYAFLYQKKYAEAIESFSKAIDIEPYFDYPYNNRGYCKLQIGDTDGAFADIHTSFEMNPENSFSWRNLGVYYLTINNLEKALHYFNEAEKIDPKTELINFYLAQAYKRIGEHDKSNIYSKKSEELDEFNYSNYESSL